MSSPADKEDITDRKAKRRNDKIQVQASVKRKRQPSHIPSKVIILI